MTFMNDRPRTFWIHGSAPGGEVFFHHALRLFDRLSSRDGGLSITCNAGIIEWLCHIDRMTRPDYLWLSDGTAIERYGRYAEVAASLGTTLLSDGSPLPPLMSQGIVVPLTNPRDDPPHYIPGEHQHVTLSGLLCLQWVANQLRGGDRVIMTGMTGYASTPAPGGIKIDTFDGRMGKAGGEHHTTQRIAPFTRSVVETWDDVEFIFCGKPHRVWGPPTAGNIPGNVQLCETITQLKNLRSAFDDALNAA